MLLFLFTNEAFFHALVWMLINSFWQGLIAAVLAGLVIIYTRNYSSALRYKLLMIVGCLFLVVIVYTFLLLYQDFKEANAAMMLQNIQLFPVLNSPGEVSKFGAFFNDINLFTSFSQFINLHANTILLLWITVLFFKCLRLVFAYRHVMDLRRKELVGVGDYWQRKLFVLSEEAGVRCTISFFQSGLAKVPMVIGFFKPVLLVPMGFFNCLPPEEVEAILVHELAHIRRRDYLVNMIQNIVEIIFFFNIPVLWISSLIRKERENACDDIAVAHTGSKDRYINALLAFNEMNITNRFITAFGGNKKMPLLDRIKRLIYNNNKNLNTMEKAGLITGVLLISFFGYAFNQKAIHKTLRNQNDTFQTSTKKLPVHFEPGSITGNADQIFVVNDQQIAKSKNHLFTQVTDTSGKGKTEITTEIEGIKYRLVFVKNKLVELYKDGVQVAANKFSDYDSIIQIIIENRKNAEENSKKAQEHEKKAQANALAAQEHQKNVQANTLLAQEHAQQALAMEKEVQVKTTESQAMAIEAEKQIALAKQHQQQSAQFARNAEANALEAGEHAKYAQLHSSIHKEFLKDGLIKEDDQHFNYNIRQGKLFINGEEQSPAVYQKYSQLINELKQSLGIQ